MTELMFETSRSKYSVAFATCAVMALASAPASAIPLRFSCSGTALTITQIQAATDSFGLSVGQTTTGSFLLNPVSGGLDSLSARADYRDSIGQPQFVVPRARFSGKLKAYFR